MPAHTFEYAAILSAALIFFARLATGKKVRAGLIAHIAFVLGFIGLFVVFGRWTYFAIVGPSLGRSWYAGMHWYEWPLLAFEWIARALAIALIDLVSFFYAVILIELLARGWEWVLGWIKPNEPDRI
jgi:hypothetical protein